MATSVNDGDLIVRGTLSPAAFNPPANSITNAAIAAAANVAGSKLQRTRGKVVYADPSATTTAAVALKPVYVCMGTSGGLVVAVWAGVIGAPVGAAVVTVDVKRAGTSILTAVITLDNSVGARGHVAGSILTSALAAGDVLEIVVTAVSGGGTLPTGLFVALDAYEYPD